MVEWYTKEQIKEAKDNGICYHTLYNRVYIYGWSVEDAIKIKPSTNTANNANCHV